MSSSDRRALARLASGAAAVRHGAGRGGLPARRSAIGALLVALSLAGAFAGCGFHLRGDVSYAFSTLYIAGPPSAPIVTELQRTLENGGQARLVTAAADAQAILDITNVIDDKGVLSLSGGGRVREYVLTKRVSFSVHDAGGRDWLPPGEVTIRRSYTFNESEVLAREVQEQRLLRDMQTDAVQQIVRRLQAAKKPVT
jgi:LPS-assembly lipoprotein